jgi:hypothetical protein
MALLGNLELAGYGLFLLSKLMAQLFKKQAKTECFTWPELVILAT